MFDGFEVRDLATDRGLIRARVGGAGPPLLVLHGYPESHLMWHAVAPALAQRHTVVAADLPGYGDSHRPAVADDHAPHSKRAMAADLVEAMAALGFETFALAGHDRGGRVAYRMALDQPDRITRLCVMDIVPTAEVWRHADRLFALVYWHWGFLSRPAPLPERLIGGDVDAFWASTVHMGLGAQATRYPAEVMDAYRRHLDDSGVIQAICEDYRAGASIDIDHDEADRAAGRRITCPTLVLWAGRGALPVFYDDVLALWRGLVADPIGHGVDASHFLAEDQPEQVAGELLDFFGG